jgi:outer membrane protein TolC
MSLKDAVGLALNRNKSVEASGAALNAADMRVAEARSGRLPKVNYSESWTRSDNPVFVFGSLLTQGQFGANNFQIDSLNHPGFLNNFQSQIAVDQPLYQAGETKLAVKSAELNQAAAREDGRRTELDVIARVIRSYYDAVLSAGELDATRQAQHSAEADLDRAQAVRTAGMSTDVDVLSIRVHLAGVTEERIRREADADVAQAALNDVIGLPLDTPHALSTGLAPIQLPSVPLDQREQNAAAQRPEARQAKLATSLAETQSAQAHSNLLPRVSLHAAFEADRQTFVTQAGDNWLLSIGLRWNLFNGGADKARIRESEFERQRSSANAARTNSAIQLEVRRAYAELRSATQRIDVAQATVAQAEESLRITQNRYEAGLSTVTDLLRTETAVLESRTRQLAAIRDQRVAAALLEQAAGTLTPDSAVVTEGSR